MHVEHSLKELITIILPEEVLSNVTLEHKINVRNANFFLIEILTSSESWINKLCIDVWFVMIGQYLKIWNLRVQKNLNIEKNTFKV